MSNQRNNKANPLRKDYWIHKLKSEIMTTQTGRNDVAIDSFCEDIMDVMEEVKDEELETVKDMLNGLYSKVHNESRVSLRNIAVVGGLIGVVSSIVTIIITLAIHG